MTDDNRERLLMLVTYERDRLLGEIKGLQARIDAADQIIADQVRAIAEIHAAARRLNDELTAVIKRIGTRSGKDNERCDH